nr:class I SAM-dependent methyltransferase [Halostagnicola kamekurae]
MLHPRSGERLLEVGPGTGYYTGTVVRAIEPSGTLHAVDVQSEMVEHLRARMRQEGTRTSNRSAATHDRFRIRTTRSMPRIWS